MGMFDYFRSSYDLGEGFTNVVCQTKDIEDYIGGTLTNYWLDPSGLLWKPEYIGTHDLQIYEESDPGYDPVRGWMNWDWIPTGKHGKYRHCDLTKYVEVHPENWKGKFEEWPSCRLHFVEGRLVDYKIMTR